MDTKTFCAKLDEVLDVPAGTVQPGQALDGLEGWDSVAVLAFIAMADAECGVAVPANAIPECRTVDDLLNLILRQKG
jgi:acyl carrier protein